MDTKGRRVSNNVVDLRRVEPTPKPCRSSLDSPTPGCNGTMTRPAPQPTPQPTRAIAPSSSSRTPMPFKPHRPFRPASED